MIEGYLNSFLDNEIVIRIDMQHIPDPITKKEVEFVAQSSPWAMVETYDEIKETFHIKSELVTIKDGEIYWWGITTYDKETDEYSFEEGDNSGSYK